MIKLDKSALLRHCRSMNFQRCSRGWFYERKYFGKKIPALYSWINSSHKHDHQKYLYSSITIAISCDGGTISVEHNETGLHEFYSVEKDSANCLEILTRCNLFSRTFGNVLAKAS